VNLVEGVVAHGDGRGRQMGFPTANVAADGAHDVPDDGVYAGIVELEDGTRHVAAVSIGRRPQYYQENGIRLVEAHLLDFDDDLYGQGIRIEIGARVRGQLVFSSSDELIAQIGRDVEAVRRAAARNAADSPTAGSA